MGHVSQAYVAGYYAGRDGLIKFEDNPCEDGATANDWVRGFKDGEEDADEINRAA